MPHTTPFEHLKLTFRAEEPAKTSALPRGWWFACLLGVAIGIGCWLSGRYYLEQQLQQRLTSAATMPEAALAVEGLLSINPDANESLVAGLQNAEIPVARSAYRALDLQITRWQNSNHADHAQQLQTLAERLQALPASTPTENLLLASSLASRLYAHYLQSNSSDHLRVMSVCEQVIRRAGRSSATASSEPVTPVATEASPSTTITAVATFQAEDAEQYTLPVPELQPPPPLAAPLEANRIEDDLDSIASYESSDAVPAASAADPGMRSTPTRASISSSTGANQATLRLTGAATRPRGDAGAHVVLRAEPENAVSQSFRLSDSTEPLEPAIEEPASIVPLNATQAVDTPSAPLSLEAKPIEELVRLLGSTQPEMAQLAALELRKRGMADDKLELALSLATGSETQRLELLDSLAVRTDIDPRAWLLWMAQDGQTSVKLRSLAYLHSMLDIDVMRSLRMQLNRESDPRVTQAIQRLLLTKADNP